MRLIASLVIAFATYSRIPMPQVEWSDENRRCTMCFFPLVGAVIGALLALWLWLCDMLDIGGLLRGAVSAVLPLLVTGGIHMDGLMDVSDAMASWQPRERRLEILKDSHVGAFAVMTCAGYLLLFAAAMSEATLPLALPLGMTFVLSRAMSAMMMTHLPSARTGGMLDGFAKAAEKRLVRCLALVYALVCIAVWLCVNLWLALACVAVTVLVSIWYRHLCMKHFGGVTGDLAGWFVQVMELALVLTIMMGGKLL